jgi:hypothetical protein
VGYAVGLRFAQPPSNPPYDTCPGPANSGDDFTRTISI